MRLNLSKQISVKKHGASSLDISIPADVIKEHDISTGDVFEVAATGDSW